MNCPFCRARLLRNEVERWGSFHCSHCHGLLRVRRNFALRIFRISFLTLAMLLVLFRMGDWVDGWWPFTHISFRIGISAAVIGVLDEYVMRFFPAKLEPGTPGAIGLR